ncbi:MAG: TIGR01777 family protein [Planctomycetaceae bacterium]|nr:MAG: TIGR01777 family protein [Planctomycetaceae bacterium]
MRVIIAGATGFIGQALCRELRGDYELVALTRDARRAASVVKESAKIVEWDARTTSGWTGQAEGAYAIINLAGESLAEGRWTPSQKMSILQSRTNSANAISDAVEGARNRPGVVIQASAVGYYGSRGDETLTEDSAPGEGFLAEVCRKTEVIAARVGRQNVRHVQLRSGIVLAQEEGALPRMMRPFRFFLGGWVGSGSQWLSWISLQDEIRAIRFLMENPNLQGPFNLTSPRPVTMKEFSRILGRVLRRPAWTRLPAFAARLTFGEMADEVLLASQQAIPKRLQEAGFKFNYVDLRNALEAIVRGEEYESG